MIRRNRPTSTAHRFARAVAVPVGIVGGLALAVVLSQHDVLTVTPADAPDKPPTRVERLLDRYDCWTGEAPPAWQGRLPVGAVVSWPDGLAAHTNRPAEVGLALDVALGKHRGHDGMRVHGFCPR